VAPHPDDEVLSSGGLIQKAVKSGRPVHIIYLTNGDANAIAIREFLHAPAKPATYRRIGNVRHLEAIKVGGTLVIPRSRLYFFSFPDKYSLHIASSNNRNQVFRSSTTLLNRAKYPCAHARNVPYSKGAAISLFLEVLRKVKPKTVIVPHPADTNRDHQAARILLLKALRVAKISPCILSYLIHYPKWPSKKSPFVPPVNLNTRRIRSLELSKEERLKKLHAFRLYRSEFHPHGRLVRLIRQREFFWIKRRSIRA
jgi:LmbE family N-acetylglucosaminyl deacetylase